MSDIRFNQWLHNSGTGGISQDSAGHVGIGTTVPTHINALTNNNSILHVGIVSCNTLNAASKIEGSIDDWIIHQDDTNTKFGFPAADTITAETAGAERLRIASDGKVGIGTVDPATIFHIHSSVPRITMSDSGTNAHHRINADSSVGNLGFEVDYASATSTPAFVVNIKGSEKLRITSAGNIGIGTDNPQVKLTVSSTSPAVCDIHHIDGGTNDEARIILGALALNPPSNRGAGIAAVNNGAGHDLIIKCSASHSVGPTEKVRITSAGKVGVGTAIPDRDLEVYNTGSQTAIGIKGGTNTAQCSLWFMKPGDGNIGGIYYLHGSDDTQGFHFRANDQQVANIKGSGILKVENNISGAGHTSGVHIFKSSGSNDDHAELAVGYDRQNCYVIQRKRNSGDIELNATQSGANVQHEYQGATRWTETYQGMINTYAAGGANFIGRWRYCQTNQSQNYEHHILGPNGSTLKAYTDNNVHGIIWVGVTGTGTGNAYCQYRFSNRSAEDSLSLTHLAGGSAANSNVPYIVANSHNAAWKMDHSGTYTMVIDVMVVGGKSSNGTYSTDSIRGANP